MSWLPFFNGSKKTEAADSDAMTVIRTLARTRRNMTVILPGAHEEQRRSFFVGVGEAPGSGFYIDLLLPQAPARSLHPDRTLALMRFMLGETPHVIKAMYAATENFGGFPALRFHPPVSVESIQRRRFHRVEPKLSEPVDLDIQNGLNETTSALDISLGGLRFRVSNKVNEGEAFELKIKIPGAPSSVLSAMAHVRDCVQSDTARRSKTGKPYFVRVEFDRIDDRSAHSLNKYLFNRQRELARFFA